MWPAVYGGGGMLGSIELWLRMCHCTTFEQNLLSSTGGAAVPRGGDFGVVVVCARGWQVFECAIGPGLQSLAAQQGGY